MLSALLSTWTLFTGIAMMMLGNGLQGSLLGVRAALEGFSNTTTGIIMTGYFVGFLVGSLVVPKLVRNVGHIRVFAALASLASVSILVHAVFVDPWVWLLMRLLTGFSYAGLYIVAESWLNERATNQNRGQLLSLYMITTYGGVAASQLLLNLAPPQNFELFVLISALVSLSLVPMSLSITEAPKLQAPKRVKLRELYRASPLGVVGALAVGVANGVWFGMGAVFATRLGLSVDQISLFMVSTYLGAMLMQWPVGWLSDRFDRRLVLTLVTFAATLCALGAIVATGGESPVGLYLAAALFGGTMMPLYSLCIAHTNDSLEPEQMVAASGTLVLVGGAGASIGPVLASLMMNGLGPSGFLWILVLIHAAIGAFALYRMTRRAPIPLEAQGSYPPETPWGSAYAAGYAAECAVEQNETTASS